MQVPAAWLSLFDEAFVIAFLPLLDSCIYPSLGHLGLHLGIGSRMALGMGFSSLAATTAGLLEFYRRDLWYRE